MVHREPIQINNKKQHNSYVNLRNQVLKVPKVPKVLRVS
jgi:hypothetical protein